MKKRPWPFLLAILLGVSVFANLAGCRREPLGKLQTKILEHEKKKILNRLRTGYQFDYPPWPAGLARGPILVLARQGLLEDYAKYEPTDDDHVESLKEGRFQLLPNGEYARMVDTVDPSQLTNFYVHLRPLAIRQFEKHYNVKVLITHLHEREHLFGNSGTNHHDTTQYDLILGDRNEILPLSTKVGLQRFNPKNLSNLEEIRTSMHAKLPRVPDDPEFVYSVPYYWGTFGFYYNLGHVPIPPETWSTLFHFEDSIELVNRVSLLDSRELMFGLGTLHLKNLSASHLEHEKANTEKLLKMFEDIRKQQPSLFGQKQRLYKLLDAFSKLHQDEEEEAKPFKSHGVKFVVPQKATGTNFKTLEEYYQNQTTNVAVKANTADISQEERMQEVVQMLKRCILFGADFRNEEDLTNLISGKDYLSIGLGGGGIIALQGNRDVRFQIPRSDNIIVLKVFVMPQEIKGARKSRAEFFLNFLLQPKCAADLVSFDLLASTSDDAREFVNPELLNSPVYSLNDSSTGYYLPIIDDSDLEEHWKEVKEFYKEVNQILESR